MPTSPSIDANAQPLFDVTLQALSDALDGNGVQSQGGLQVTDGTGNNEADIAPGTAFYDGSSATLGSTTTVTHSSGDGSNDRWDLIAFDVSAGSVVKREGTAATGPVPPDLQSDEVLLALVYVETNQTDFGSDAIVNWRFLGGIADHDHSESTLSQVPTGGLADDAVTAAKVVADAIGTSELNLSITPTWTGTHTFSAGADMGSAAITSVADPSNAQDAATKAYVDAVEQALDIKDSVRAASNGNIDLTSTADPNPVGGVTLSDGDRVLLKDQTTASENGVYEATTATDPTTWSRAPDADEDAEVTSGLFVFVEEGDHNNRGFVLTTADPITVGTTALSFTQFSGAGQLTAGTGLSKTGDTIDANLGNGIKDDGSDNIQAALATDAGLKIVSGELAVEPSDIAGSFLSDDGSDALQVDIGNGVKDDGNGNLAAEPGEFAGAGLADDGNDNLAVDVVDEGTITAAGGASPAVETTVTTSLSQTDRYDILLHVDSDPSFDADYAFSWSYDHVWDDTNSNVDLTITVNWQTDPGSGNDVTLRWTVLNR